MRRKYGPGDLAGYQLAFAATNDRAVNQAIAREGQDRGAWVNVVDEPARGDFIVPAVLRRGDLVVAVGTGGASPALAGAIRAALEAYFTEEWADLVEGVASLRRALREGAGRPGPGAWRRAPDGDLRRLNAEGKHEEARTRLLGRLRAGSCG